MRNWLRCRRSGRFARKNAVTERPYACARLSLWSAFLLELGYVNRALTVHNRGVWNHIIN